MDGRGRSIWDKFSSDPSHAEDGGSNEPATDFYNQYESDIALMKSFGEEFHGGASLSLIGLKV